MPRRRDYPNRKEYMLAYQREWMRRRRAAFFGGKACDTCNSGAALQLHHRDPSQKISHQIWSWSEARRNAELSKCVVLCGACHQQLTSLDFASRRPSATLPAGSSGMQNIRWYAQRRTWRVEFVVMGRRIWVGGGGFRNIVTARLAAESFRSTLAAHYGRQNIEIKISCRKQFTLPLEFARLNFPRVS
jgi:hypothetical protein